MGYVTAYGSCLACGRVFGFNPTLVPSHPAVRGEDGKLVPVLPDDPRLAQAVKAPICEDCIRLINDVRARRGEPVWPVPAGAYEAADEGEVF